MRGLTDTGSGVSILTFAFFNNLFESGRTDWFSVTTPLDRSVCRQWQDKKPSDLAIFFVCNGESFLSGCLFIQCSVFKGKCGCCRRDKLIVRQTNQSEERTSFTVRCGNPLRSVVRVSLIYHALP